MNIGGINTYKQMQQMDSRKPVLMNAPRPDDDEMSEELKAEITAVSIARERRDTKTIAIDLLNSGAAFDAADAIVKAKEMNFKHAYDDALSRVL